MLAYKDVVGVFSFDSAFSCVFLHVLSQSEHFLH